jgi:hypothetical protein
MQFLARRGLDVVELPFQAHPDIPLGGIAECPIFLNTDRLQGR